MPTPSREYSSRIRPPSVRASTRCALLTPFLQATREASSPVGMPMACQLHMTHGQLRQACLSAGVSYGLHVSGHYQVHTRKNYYMCRCCYCVALTSCHEACRCRYTRMTGESRKRAHQSRSYSCSVTDPCTALEACSVSLQAELAPLPSPSPSACGMPGIHICLFKDHE